MLLQILWCSLLQLQEKTWKTFAVIFQWSEKHCIHLFHCLLYFSQDGLSQFLALDYNPRFLQNKISVTGPVGMEMLRPCARFHTILLLEWNSMLLKNTKTPGMTIYFSGYFSVYLKVTLGRWQTDRLKHVWLGDLVMLWVSNDSLGLSEGERDTTVSELSFKQFCFFFPNISSPFHSPLRCTANLDGSVVKLSTTVQNPPLPQKARDQRQLTWALNRTGQDGTGQDRVEEERKEEKKRRGRVQLVDIFKDHLIISSH